MNNSENSYWHTLKNDFINYVKAEILSPNGEHKRYRRSMDLASDCFTIDSQLLGTS